MNDFGFFRSVEYSFYHFYFSFCGFFFFLYVSFIIFGAPGFSTLLTANFMPRDFFYLEQLHQKS